jgi:hypothetical protein
MRNRVAVPPAWHGQRAPVRLSLMRILVPHWLFASCALLAVGCSSSSSPTPTGTDSGGAADAGGAADTGAPSDGGGGAAVTLKLENYLSWCSVAVNGGAPSSTEVQTLSFAPGTVVNLTANPASASFVFAYWVGTAGDTTATHDTQKATTVTMTGNKVVQACCPFASAPNTPCPAPTP